MRAVKIFALITAGTVVGYLALGLVVSVFDIDTNIDTGNAVANTVGFGLIALFVLSATGLAVSALYQGVDSIRRRRS